jgi:hypothetical protein
LLAMVRVLGEQRPVLARPMSAPDHARSVRPGVEKASFEPAVLLMDGKADQRMEPQWRLSRCSGSGPLRLGGKSSLHEDGRQARQDRLADLRAYSGGPRRVREFETWHARGIDTVWPNVPRKRG